ncbi:MAG: hypothetical protein A2V93_10310 [Ignavibacteria bacterium RBG_16_34_14]|nr:MAG: hypothetical protein A2V93_10310 [Ignavibacteria bacterium RBG_16_34_14]
MTDSYHKARKSYGLFSALLIAWELIGIKLTPEPIESLKIIIKTPEIAPYVLLILVIYFAYRFTIEWLLINEEGRKIRPARIDFYVAHGIGVISVIIIIVQAITEIQIGTYIVHNPFKILILIFSIFIVPEFYLINIFSEIRNDSVNFRRGIRVLCGVAFSILIVPLFIVSINEMIETSIFFLIGLCSGASYLGLLRIVMGKEKMKHWFVNITPKRFRSRMKLEKPDN